MADSNSEKALRYAPAPLLRVTASKKTASTCFSGGTRRAIFLPARAGSAATAEPSSMLSKVERRTLAPSGVDEEKILAGRVGLGGKVLQEVAACREV